MSAVFITKPSGCMAQGVLEAGNDWNYIDTAKKSIEATRPTAHKLFYATNRVYNSAKKSDNPKHAALEEVQRIADEDGFFCLC